MALSTRLQQLRKHAGFSQEHLAELLEVSRQSVSKWETGQASPDITYIIKLSEIYHVSTDAILKDTPPQAEETAEPVPAGEPAKPKGISALSITLAVVIIIAAFFLCGVLFLGGLMFFSKYLL